MAKIVKKVSSNVGHLKGRAANARANAKKAVAKKPAVIKSQPLPDVLTARLEALTSEVNQLKTLLSSGTLRVLLADTPRESVQKAVKAERIASEETTRTQADEHTPAVALGGPVKTGQVYWFGYLGSEDEPARPEKVRVTGVSMSGIAEIRYECDGAESSVKTTELYPLTENGKQLANFDVMMNAAEHIAKKRRRAELVVFLLGNGGVKADELAKLTPQDIVIVAQIVGLNPFKAPMKDWKGKQRLEMISAKTDELAEEKGSSKILKEAKLYLVTSNAEFKSPNEVTLERQAFIDKLNGKAPKPSMSDPDPEDEPPVARVIAVGDWIIDNREWFKVTMLDITTQFLVAQQNKKLEKQFKISSLKFERLTATKNTPVWIVQVAS